MVLNTLLYQGTKFLSAYYNLLGILLHVKDTYIYIYIYEYDVFLVLGKCQSLRGEYHMQINNDGLSFYDIMYKLLLETKIRKQLIPRKEYGALLRLHREGDLGIIMRKLL